jgi:cullin-4
MQQNSSGDTEKRSGKRQSIGKRKLSDQGEPSQPRSHTISGLLSERHTPEPTHQQSHKRSRLSTSPQTAASHKMYPSSGAPPNNGALSGRGGPTGPEARFSASNSNARQNNFTPHTGARKLVVRNLRKEPRLDQDSYFEKVWSQFDAALTAIFDGKTPENSLEELYKGGENVCRQNRADLLAKNLRRRCKDFVNGGMRQDLLTKAKGSGDIDTLRAVMEAWSSWHSKLVRKRNDLSSNSYLTANH